KDGRCFDVYNPHAEYPAVFSPDGEWAAVLKKPKVNRGTITLFHIQDWNQTFLDLPAPTFVFGVSPQPLVWTGTADGSSVISNPAGKILDTLQFAPHHPSLSRDGIYVAGSVDESGTVFLSRTQAGRNRRDLRGQTGANSFNAFDPNTTQVLTASDDNTVREWAINRTPIRSTDASWQEIIKYLRTSTKACLLPNERRGLLSESLNEAKQKARQCEEASQASQP